MKFQEIPNLGSMLVVLGICFSSDRLIGYSFIGAGIVLSIITIIRVMRENGKKPSKEES